MSGVRKERRQLIVALGCITRGTEVLLTKRVEPMLPQVHLRWDLPGGKVDFGESPVEAVEREIREETGYEAVVREMFPFVHSNVWQYSTHIQHTIIICYWCELVSGGQPLRVKDAEIGEFQWMDIGHVDLNKALPSVRHFLGWFARKKLGLNIAGDDEPMYIHLRCVDPGSNTFKFYIVNNQPGIGPTGQLDLFEAGDRLQQVEVKTTPLVLNRFYGRIGAKPRCRAELYYSKEKVTRRILQIFREKVEKGYRLVESSLGSSEEDVIFALAARR